VWKKENEVVGQRLPGSVDTYSEAVEEFSKHATELFVAHARPDQGSGFVSARKDDECRSAQYRGCRRREPAESYGSVGRGDRRPFGQTLVAQKDT
jgi:hypothetical protein